MTAAAVVRAELLSMIKNTAEADERGLRSFYILYDIAFIALTIVPTWILPYDPIIVLQIDIFLVCLILTVLFVLHQKNARIAGFTGWLLILAAGVLWLVVAMAFEPIWWTFTVLVIESGLVSAVHQLGPKLPSALIVAIGFSICYGAIVGFIREIFLRIIERSKQSI